VEGETQIYSVTPAASTPSRWLNPTRSSTRPAGQGRVPGGQRRVRQYARADAALNRTKGLGGGQLHGIACALERVSDAHGRIRREYLWFLAGARSEPTMGVSSPFAGVVDTG
jgi:hypothetical protein